ncbi:MAG: outer membrane beta-barrel protein [Bacteroidota bacterium]
MRVLGVILLAVLLTPARALAQNGQLDLKVGAAFSTLSGESESAFTGRSGLTASLGYRYTLRGAIHVQPELVYIVKGANAESPARVDDDGNFLLPIEARFDLTYLELPVLLVLERDGSGAAHPRFEIGPSVAYNLESVIHFGVKGSDQRFSERDESVEALDYGLVVGLGMTFDLGLERMRAGVRAHLGFANARERDDLPLYNRGIVAYFGIAL